jgi:hypothetical protein
VATGACVNFSSENDEGTLISEADIFEVQRDRFPDVLVQLIDGRPLRKDIF